MKTRYNYLIAVLLVVLGLAITHCAHSGMNECQYLCRHNNVAVYKGEGLECVCGR